MKINLTKYQIRKIRTALYLAKSWEESVIDSLMVGLKIVNGRAVHFVPYGMKKDANLCEKNIKSFIKVSNLLGQQLKEENNK